MNKLEEIAKKHLDEWNGVTGFVQPETQYYAELVFVIEEAMKEHADQRLEELKEKVERYRGYARIWHNEAEMHRFSETIEDVLQLIEDIK